MSAGNRCPTSARTASTTPSMGIPVESIATASWAGRSGATARVESRRSRSRISCERAARLTSSPFSFNCLWRLPGTLFGGSREVDLEPGPRGKGRFPCRARPRPVPGNGKGPLACKQRAAHGRHGGYPRCSHPGRLGAKPRRDVPAAQQDGFLARATSAVNWTSRACSEPGVPGLIVHGQPGVHPCQGNESIQRSAVEQMPAQAGRHAARDGPLAGPARPIDGDDGGTRRPGPERPALLSCSLFDRETRPTLLAAAANPGNEVATLATSWYSTVPEARRAATAKAIAMR